MSVFLSYSSKDNEYRARLDTVLYKHGVNIIDDNRKLNPLDDIKLFMQSIKVADHAIILLSSNYLKSEACIYEFSEFLKNQDSAKKIIPVLVDNLRKNAEIKSEFLEHIKKENLLNPSKKHFFKRIFSRKKYDVERLNEWKDRFNKTWNFIWDIKFINFEMSKAHEFSDILTILGVYEEKIIKSLDEISKINDEELQEIRFNELQKLHPGSYWVIFYKGILSVKNKKYRRAIAYYQEFASNFSDPKSHIITYHEIGCCYYHLEDFKNAVTVLKEGLKLYPGFYYFLNDLGDINKKLGKKKVAVKYYKLSNKAKRNHLALINLAVNESENGNNLIAISYAEEAIRMYELDPVYFLNLAVFYRRAGDKKKYDEILSDAYVTFPDDYLVLTNYARNSFDGTYDLSHTQYFEILKKSFHLNPDYIDTRLDICEYVVFSHLNKQRDKVWNIEFARLTLLKTLEMNVTETQKDIAMKCLEIIYFEEKASYGSVINPEYRYKGL